MPTFTTPSVVEKFGEGRLFSRVSLNRRVTVLKDALGGYTQVSNPDPADIESATIAYLGGRSYTIDSTEAAALTAAGYGAYITP